MLSFILNQVNIGDYRKENQAPSVLYAGPFVCGRCGWFCVGWQSKSLVAPCHGGACRRHRTQLHKQGMWTWGGWVPCNDVASQSATTGLMNGQLWVFCSPWRLWASALCRDVPLLRVVQMILVGELRHLYCRNAFATEPAVCVFFCCHCSHSHTLFSVIMLYVQGHHLTVGN